MLATLKINPTTGSIYGTKSFTGPGHKVYITFTLFLFLCVIFSSLSILLFCIGVIFITL